MHDKYIKNVAYCEAFLRRFGDTYRGVGWTRTQAEVDRRYMVMLELIRSPATEPVTLLDFGCGASHLLEFIRKNGYGSLRYSGLDLSKPFLELSRSKFPTVDYYDVDIVKEGPTLLPQFDYVIANGTFTGRRDMAYEEMFDYFTAATTALFSLARCGIAFNVMSKHVEWEREDLFHVSLDRMTNFVTDALSRDFLIRHDYGSYEYTTYVYR